MARLIVNPSSSAAWEIQLKPGVNYLGRGFSNDFQLDDPSVSGSHCQITVSESSVVIKDLGSTNGTYINRSKVHEAVLQSGQTVHLGGVELRYHGDAPAGSAPVAVVVSGAGAPPIPKPTGTPVRVTVGSAPPIRVAAPVAGGGVAVAAPARPTEASPQTEVLPRPAIPVPPPIAQSPVATAQPPGIDVGPQFCKSHPKTQARFACGQCRHYFCELCVTSRQVGPVQKKFCRHCGTECTPLRVQIQRHRSGEKSFFARLPDAFSYPVRGSGIMMLVVGALIFALLNWVIGGGTYVGPMFFSPWKIVASIVATGYLFAYLQSIIHSTAIEEAELPPLPTIANAWQDILLPALQFLGLVLFCLAPAFALTWYRIAYEAESMTPVIVGAYVLGGLYFPMAFLAVAMLDSVLAANPLQVIPSIFKAPLEYLVAILSLVAMLALRAGGSKLIPLVFPRGLLTHNMAKLAGYLGAQALWGVVSMYLLVVGFHILGLVYVSKRDKLGWLDH